MNTVISADIGTTAAKVSLVERSGEILFTTSHSYPLVSEASRVEQDPLLWWDAFRKGIKDIYSYQNQITPEALVLSGQMQDLICISRGEAEGNAILYSDTRARGEWIQINRDLGKEFLNKTTENLNDPGSLPCKILWLRNSKSCEIDNETRILLGAHDYICWKLTDRFITDYTNGAATGLMNFESNQWDSTILKYLGLVKENLPELISADQVTGSITAEASNATGLPAGLPVIHGSGDAGASTIGAGAGVPGVISCYLGTSGWIAVTGERTVNPDSGIFNLRHPDPSKVINIGPMLMTGGNVEWALNTLSGDRKDTVLENSFDTFTREAEKAFPGSGGLFYLPYLVGERSPFRDPDARGAFIGMGRQTGQSEMFRAVLEGTSYALNSILDVMSQTNHSTGQIYLSGGGARDPLWAEILASITGYTVLIASNARETGVLGNVVLAGRALGWFDTYKLPSGFLNIEKEYLPDNELNKFYAGGMEIFKELYPALKQSFKKTAKWLNQ